MLSFFLGVLRIRWCQLSHIVALVLIFKQLCHDWFLLSPASPSLLWTTLITSVPWLAMGEFWTSLSVERKLIKLTSFLGESYQDGFLDTKGPRVIETTYVSSFAFVFVIVLLASTSYPGRLYWRSQNSWVPQFVHVSSTRICKKKLDGINSERFGTAGRLIRAFKPAGGYHGSLGKPPRRGISLSQQTSAGAFVLHSH